MTLNKLLDGMTEIRSAHNSDLAIVSSWLRSQADCEMWAGHSISYPVDLLALPDVIEWNESDSWIVSLHGEVAAFGQLVPKSESRLHLARIIVAPGHRAKGLGRILTVHLLDIALATVVSAVSLNVSPDNNRAIALYHSLGFSEASRPAGEPESLSLYMTHAVMRLQRTC